jgi:lipoate-protein ligase A
VKGTSLDWETAAKAFVLGFEQVFAIQFIQSSPTAKELSRTAELMETKYANAAWTNRI